MKTLLTTLKWRYAVKEYHKSQRLEDSEIDQIKQAIQLSPSSYGLQLYKVYDVRDSEKTYSSSTALLSTKTNN